MKGKIWIGLLAIFSGILLACAGTNLFTVERAAGLNTGDGIDLAAAEQAQVNSFGLPASQSCANPTADNAASCQSMEQEILASTVRIMMVTSLMHVEGAGYLILNGNGYGTIKDGRYLVTHNHYNETVFSLVQQGDPDNMVNIIVFNARDEIVLRVPARTVTVLIAESQTTILDFGETNAVCVFAALGLPSAEFTINPALTLAPGTEIAQIDWDGSTAHVNWATVEAVFTASERPFVKLSSCI